MPTLDIGTLFTQYNAPCDADHFVPLQFRLRDLIKYLDRATYYEYALESIYRYSLHIIVCTQSNSSLFLIDYGCYSQRVLVIPHVTLTLMYLDNFDRLT